MSDFAEFLVLVGLPAGAVVFLAVLILAVLDDLRTKRRRFEAAKAALTGLLADPTCRSHEIQTVEGSAAIMETCTQATVRIAVEHGDALIKELDK